MRSSSVSFEEPKMRLPLLPLLPLLLVTLTLFLGAACFGEPAACISCRHANGTAQQHSAYSNRAQAACSKSDSLLRDPTLDKLVTHTDTPMNFAAAIAQRLSPQQQMCKMKLSDARKLTGSKSGVYV